MTILEEKVNPFIESIERSIQTENWYAALTLSLALPDICGRLENPKLGSEKRYIKFFNTYLKSFYISKVGEQKEIEFLSGSDMYALRCSFLHEGSSEIEHQRARDILNSYIFVNGSKYLTVHKNMFISDNEKKLQLQVNKFSEEIVAGVKSWLEDCREKQYILNQAESMIKIVDLSSGVDFSIG